MGSTEETKYLNNTLEKGFESFQLADIPFTLPASADHDHDGHQQPAEHAPPGGYRLYKSRFVGLVALVSVPKQKKEATSVRI
jgi:hypothetical protein